MNLNVECEDVKGTIFDIERFAVHDGYGIRTLVFLKGCPLKCQWCSNPESQVKSPQIGFFKEKCVNGIECPHSCPFGKSYVKDVEIDWNMNCNQLTEECVYGARVVYGKEMSVKEVLNIVKKDVVFYKNSGGGMTLGGGEATFQPEFAKNILKCCQNEGVHTAMETCGYSKSAQFDEIIEHVDLLLFDIKHMDSLKHKQYTGGGNEIILKNAIMASKKVKNMIIRYPLIPGFNDDEENVTKLGEFITESLVNVDRVDLLPYHSTGESKGDRIGRTYTFKHTSEIDDKKIYLVKNILQSFGLKVKIGG